MKDSQGTFNLLADTLNQIIVGQERTIRRLLIALLAGGHVILEGVPGTGKTLTVKTLSRLIQADFRRVQLTPDVLPADILGTSIFDFNTKDFTLKRGPVFTDILLADEINRTPPKTQAALLEAMAERQVTLEGNTLPLSELFWTIATQNSLEFEGTYPLPEAQLDRFLFKLLVDYPNAASEKEVLINSISGKSASQEDLNRLQPILTMGDCLQARHLAAAIPVKDNILDYLVELLQKTRQHPDLALGASPRAGVYWLQASKAAAWLENRDFVTPDDLKFVAVPLLRHRLMLRPEAQLDGVKIDDIVLGILQQVPVPR
jgi:MoxR-like ATPase